MPKESIGSIQGSRYTLMHPAPECAQSKTGDSEILLWFWDDACSRLGTRVTVPVDEAICDNFYVDMQHQEGGQERLLSFTLECIQSPSSLQGCTWSFRC